MSYGNVVVVMMRYMIRKKYSSPHCWRWGNEESITMRTGEKMKIWSKIPTQKSDRQPTPSSALPVFAPIQLDFLHKEDCTASILRGGSRNRILCQQNDHTR